MNMGQKYGGEKMDSDQQDTNTEPRGNQLETNNDLNLIKHCENPSHCWL
jgi:hypothetical protein